MNRPELLTTAERIGIQLARTAIWDQGYCNWMGWHTVPTGQPVPLYKWQSLGPSVYEGTAGIAWFLIDLADGTGEELFKRTAVGAVRHAIRHADDGRQRYSLSLFSGAFGIALTALKAGHCLNQPELVDEGWRLLLRFSESAAVDFEDDIIGGISGALPCLIALCQCRSQDSQFQWLEEFIDRVSHQLLAHSTCGSSDEAQTAPGRYWANESFSPYGLTGYSHGNAGMLNALAEVAHFRKDPSLMQSAKECLVYEREHYRAEFQNWLDLRQLDPPLTDDAPKSKPARGDFLEKASASLAWCHGAPGIGLGRLRTMQLMGEDSEIELEIQRAIDATQVGLAFSPDQSPNFSLCHGVFGNAELILAAQESPLSLRVDETPFFNQLDYVLEHQRNPHVPWKCGTQDGRSTPGLMLGIAGMGAALLRLADSRYRLPLLITPDFCQSIWEPSPLVDA